MNELVEKIPPLSWGAHRSLDHGACIMEAVAFVAGEPWSDHPECACPVISVFLRSWNDALSDDDRDTLLRPLILLLPGTRDTAEVEKTRAIMAVDWLIRVYFPGWLRPAKLNASALALASDFAQRPSVVPVLAAIADAAGDVLKQPTPELQQSALALVHRMIEVGKST